MIIEGLFAAVGLRNEQAFQIDAKAFGPGGIEGVFRVDKSRYSTEFLGLGHHVQGEGGLAAGFRAEHLRHPAPRHTPATESQI